MSNPAPSAAKPLPSDDLAERVRRLLLAAAASAYEDARISGLCCEGAWEIARDALRDADLSAAIRADGAPAQHQR
ncbi:MAG TPA: hypothetical protein VF265_02380 [Nevskiaceae bacterium]